MTIEEETGPADPQDLELFWEYIKAQGCQVARIWGRCIAKEHIRALDPVLAENLDALWRGVKDG